MDLQLTNKQVLVTGASKGIGLATAQAFAAEGARLVLVARTAEALDRAAADIRDQSAATVETLAADLSTDAGREALFAAYPNIDVLVNNAGAIPAGRLQDLPMERWHEGWSLKVFGYIHLCQLYAASMSARGAGTIVNIIGMGGRAVRPDYICGAAGNAALIGFTQALGAETPASNVRVFGINPAATMTDRIIEMSKTRAEVRFGDSGRWEELLQGESLPFGRIKQPQEVAALAAMLCAPQVHYLSGTVIDLDGGGQWRG